MSTATATRPTAGTRAVDRITYAKTGRKTRTGAPIYTVIVDGVAVGNVGRIGSEWHPSTGGGYYGRSSKAEAAAIVVALAVEAGTIRDLDEIAQAVADEARAAAEITDPDRDDEDNRHQAREIAARLVMLPGVRDGDVIEYADGTRRRVCGVYSGRTVVQVTPGYEADGSVHVSTSGHTQHSGACGPTVDPASLTEAGTVQAAGWMWHHGIAGGGRGVPVRLPFRLFTSTEETPSR